MSDYQDFAREFPARCAEILNEFHFDAQASGREVTLLLSTSASMICLIADRIGLTATDERKIRKVPTGAKAETTERWKRLEDSFSLLAHKTWSAEVVAGVGYCPAEFTSKRRLPDEWNWSQLPETKSIRDCYSLLRNAFAHGNIWTAAGSTKHITTLVFASKLDAEDGAEKPVEGFRMSPETLRVLMVWWIETVCEAGGEQRFRKPRVITERKPVK